MLSMAPGNRQERCTMAKSSPDQTAQSSDEVRRRSLLVMWTLPIVFIPIGVLLLIIVLLRFSHFDQYLSTADQRRGLFWFPIFLVVVTTIFFSAIILFTRLRRPNVSAIILIATWTFVTTIVSF